MPTAPVHDGVTFLLAAPAAAAAYLATGSIALTAVGAAAFIFGGIMFGPDLDTMSKQYSRWSIFKLLWLPYRSFFKHRSRWSHGLIFGAFLRVVYFLGAITLASFASLSVYSWYVGGGTPELADLAGGWHNIGRSISGSLGPRFLPTVFAGMWLGAASHTLTDITVTYIKTGRTGEFL